MEVSEIKVIRKKLGLTQAQLAKKSGVSQSLIAKIEAGKIDPTYSKVKKIFAYFEGLREKHSLKASDIMKKSGIFAKPQDSVKEIIAKMKKYEISQLPVVLEGNCIGLVSEGNILDALIEGKTKKVEDIMEDAPPIVSSKTDVNVVSELLRHVPIVLVAVSGKIKGVVTKSDVLGNLKN